MSGSSASWCKETDEKINYTKLCRLLVDGGTQAVRSVFDGIHPPSSLKAILNSNKTTLQKLKKPKGKVLNNEQWDKLYSPSGSNPKSEDFDITLLFVLLRNICGLTPPVYEITGSRKRKCSWDKLPHKTENSQEANLTRIKYYRNNIIAHKSSTEINDVDFNQHWQDISSALLSLGLSQDDIDDLMSDPLGKKDYNQLLYDWYMSDKDIKTQLEEVKSNTADIRSDTALIPGIQEDISQLKNTICSNSNLNDSLINQLANSDFSSLIESLCKSFHPNTRQWVLDEVESHINKDPSELTSNGPAYGGKPEACGMLIRAGAGMGKSTLAAKLCQTYKKKGCLAGCHFFQFSNSTRNDPRLMLQSIARQMCDTVPGYREALESKLQTDLGKKISEMNCEELFTVLLEEPCNKMKMDDVTTERCVIVDALDECCNDLKFEFLHALEYALRLLPTWLRFIITTRPSTSYTSSELKNFNIDPKDSRNKLDLEIFFKDKLNELNPSDDLSKLVSQLVQTTKGLFLVAFFVVDYVQKQKITLASDILGLFPKGISSVYERYFDRLKEVLLPYISHEKNFFEMLEAIVAAKHPIEKNFLYRILGLKTQRQIREIPGLSIKSRKTAVDLLHSLFPVENDHVTVFHKSVVDWLIQEDTDHDFSVRAEDGSEVLAAYQSHDYRRNSYEGLHMRKYTSSVCPGGENEDVASQSSSAGDIQNSNEELPLKKAVSVEEGKEILANQCYDVLSDIRNGKKDLDKPLNLTDSEKYALEFGIQYIIDSCAFSKDKKMEVLMNCFIICSALLTYNCLNREVYSVPFKSNSSHFDVSKEVPKVLHYGKFVGTLRGSHVKPCPFSLPLNFIQCVGFFLQAVRAIGLNEDELSPNPKNLIKEYRLPFLSCNHIASIPDEGFLRRTSVIDLIPETQLSIAPSKDGMIIVKFNKRQTLVNKYNEDGTCLVEKAFSGLKKMCITPDQRSIVATEVDKRGEVEMIDPISLELVKKYQSPNVVKSCHVFGDQPWYIVARCYNNKIYVMEGETGEIHTTFDVENDEEVEAVSSSGHIALSKTWVSTRVRNLTLFTDDDGNFLGEMVWGETQFPDKRSSSTYRKLFLLNALKPCIERVYFYPRREDTYPCTNTYMDNLSYQDQAITFSQDGVLLAYHYKESIFIVKSEDGSLFKRVHVDNGVGDIIQLSDSHIIFRNSGTIFIIDVTTNKIKHALYLPGNPRKVYVVPRQQEKPLAIIVEDDNVEEMREKPSLKRYSIFRYVFHNLDL